MISSYFKGADDVLASFVEIVEQLSSECTIVSAKIAIKHKMKKVFKFASEVIGKDELTVLARPYINISSQSQPPPAAKI